MSYYQIGVNEKLDYGIDFSGLLYTNESVTQAEWSVEDDAGSLNEDLVLSLQTTDGQLATLYVEGAQAGKVYHLRCVASTSSGRRYVRWITMEGVQRRV